MDGRGDEACGKSRPSALGKGRGLPPGRQYPLVRHLLDTGAAARCLWDAYVPAGLRKYIADGFGVTVEHAGALFALWAALHDIGKLTPEFQRQDRHADLSGYPRQGRASRLRMTWPAIVVAVGPAAAAAVPCRSR